MSEIIVKGKEIKFQRLNDDDYICINFNPLEFEGVRRQVDLKAFLLSPKKWVEPMHIKYISVDTRSLCIERDCNY